MGNKTNQNKTVSPLFVAGVVILCLVAVYFLLPNPRKLVERQMRDGAPDRALKTINGLSREERQKDEKYFAMAEVEARSALLARHPAKALETLSRALDLQSQFPDLPEWGRMFEEILPFVDEVSEAAKIIFPYTATMREETRRKVFSMLVARSLALGKPEEAARFQEELFSTTQTEEDLVEAVRLWRMAGNAREGQLLLTAFLEKQPNANRQLRFLQVELLHELGQPELAYEVLSRLGAEKPLDEKQFELQVRLARESGKGQELLPLLTERLEKNPSDKNWLLLAAELAQGANDLKMAENARLKLAELEPMNGEHQALAAQFMEWQNQPSRAFDHYLEGWKRGYTPALSRLLALYPGLFKSVELAEILGRSEVKAIPQDHLPPTAALFQEAGLYDKPAVVYNRILELEPHNLQMMEQQAWMLVDLLYYERALGLFRNLREKQPENLNHLRGEAESLFRSGRPSEALALYEKLAYNAKDLKMIENYIVLSTSLGALANVPKILEYKLANFSKKSSQDYRRLAHAYNMTGETNAMVQALLRGVAAFPGDLPLQLAASYALGAAGDVEAASKLLAKNPAVRSDPSLAQVYLGMLLRRQDYAEAERFLKSGLSTQVLESPSLLETHAELAERRQDFGAASVAYKKLWDLNPNDQRSALNYARLLVRNGKAREAEKLLSRLINPKMPESYKFAAEIYSAAGKYKLAEKYQDLYLKSKPEEMPQAFGFLGDIRLSRGDKINARRAYQKGLDAMLEDINQSSSARAGGVETRL